MSTDEKIWLGEYKPTLDELLSDQQPVSPPFEIEIGNKKLTIAFRSLSRSQIAKLQLDARVYARQQVKRAGLPIDDIDSPYVTDLVANELELRCLWASAVNPDSPGGRGPAFTIKKLRDSITPTQQEQLNDRWYMWQTRSSMDELSEDDFNLIIEGVKNRDFFLLLKFGTGKLLNCMHTLINRLETYEMNKSSAGSSKKNALKNMSN